MYFHEQKINYIIFCEILAINKGPLFHAGSRKLPIFCCWTRLLYPPWEFINLSVSFHINLAAMVRKTNIFTKAWCLILAAWNKISWIELGGSEKRLKVLRYLIVNHNKDDSSRLITARSKQNITFICMGRLPEETCARRVHFIRLKARLWEEVEKAILLQTNHTKLFLPHFFFNFKLFHAFTFVYYIVQ